MPCWLYHRRSVVCLLASALFCVLLGNSAAPLLAAAVLPESGCAKPRACACSRNGRICHCDHQRPAGFWSAAQPCHTSRHPFVRGASAASSALPIFTCRPAVRGITADRTQPAHRSVHLSRTFQRGPPLILA